MVEYDIITSNQVDGMHLDSVNVATAVTNCTIESNAIDGVWMEGSISLVLTTDTVLLNKVKNIYSGS